MDLSVLPLMRSALAALGRADEEFDADLMRAAMRQAPAAAWLAEIRAVDVAVELINPLGSLLADEDVAVNGYVVEVSDPEHGRIRQAAPPFRTQPPGEVRGPAPSLGQHTAEVLAETVVALKFPRPHPVRDARWRASAWSTSGPTSRGRSRPCCSPAPR
ncbi:CoA transferase [Amycolatopsis acidiphila]|uniref:CoA transferase n=1 Tax=Amycolatopsis acidiphila TaxID=715473 RepID=UPI001643BABD|nr:CoA transferase [Amycolatopsis acidiphila]GHG73908.1 hypothetical protein GCM10017788_37350 [Amycolatopsis acidiphila]